MIATAMLNHAYRLAPHDRTTTNPFDPDDVSDAGPAPPSGRVVTCAFTPT